MKDKEHKIESFTTPGKFYVVKEENGKFSCTCPAFEKRRKECKHIRKVLGKKNNDEYEMRSKSGIPLDICVSGLQKEIRRSNVKNAVFLVQDLVLAGFIRYAYRRLAIIASEDAGANPMATMMVHACYENDRMSTQEFKKGNEGVLITQAVVYLCKSKKNRLNDDLWQYLLAIRKKGEKPEVKDYFKDELTKIGRQMGRSEDYWYRESSKLVNEEGENPYRAKLQKIWVGQEKKK